MARQAKTWMMKTKHHQPAHEIDLKSMGPVDVESLLASVRRGKHEEPILQPPNASAHQELITPYALPAQLSHPAPAITPPRHQMAQTHTREKGPIRAPNGRLFWKHATLNERIAIIQRNFPSLARYSSVEIRNHILSGKADAQIAKAGELWDAGKLK